MNVTFRRTSASNDRSYDEHPHGCFEGGPSRDYTPAELRIIADAPPLNVKLHWLEGQRLESQAQDTLDNEISEEESTLNDTELGKHIIRFLQTLLKDDPTLLEEILAHRFHPTNLNSTLDYIIDENDTTSVLGLLNGLIQQKIAITLDENKRPISIDFLPSSEKNNDT